MPYLNIFRLKTDPECQETSALSLFRGVPLNVMARPLSRAWLRRVSYRTQVPRLEKEPASVTHKVRFQPGKSRSVPLRSLFLRLCTGRVYHYTDTHTELFTPVNCSTLTRTTYRRQR